MQEFVNQGTGVNYHKYWAGQVLPSNLPFWDSINPETVIMKLETKVE